MAVNGVEIEVGQVWTAWSKGGSHRCRIVHRSRGADVGWLAERTDDPSGIRTWFDDNGVSRTLLGHTLLALVPDEPDFPPLDLPAEPVAFLPKSKIPSVPERMSRPGYETLANVLQRAYNQAAVGKGVERHAAAGEPFDKQVMQIGAQKFGHGSLLFQAFKKSEESQRLPHDRAVNELLGAIVYLAGAVVALEAAKDSK